MTPVGTPRAAFAAKPPSPVVPGHTDADPIPAAVAIVPFLYTFRMR